MNLETNRPTYHVNTKYRTRKNRRKIITMGIFWIFLMMLTFISIFKPSSKKEVPYKDIGLVINGLIIESDSKPLIVNSEPLIELSNIKKYINKDILFDSNENTLILTTNDKVARIKVDSTEGTINNKPLILRNKVLIQNNRVYVPIAEFEDFYNIDVQYFKETNVIVIDTKKVIYNSGLSKYNGIQAKDSIETKSRTVTKLNKGEPIEIIEEKEEHYKVKTNKEIEGYVESKLIEVDGLIVTQGQAKNSRSVVRKNPSIRQPIYKTMAKEEKLNIFGEVDDWYKVRTIDGVIGFIKKSHVNDIVVVNNTVIDEENVVWKPVNGKINLVWEQVENSTPSMNNVDKVEGLDVVSPTWFQVIKADGTLKNKADIMYVRWARGNGYKVWGLLSNGVSTDSEKMTSEFLNSSKAREKAINELIKYASIYELDGINVDFEHFAVEDRDMYTQFLRELAPLCKDKGLVLSVDVTVKVDSPNSLCFDRKNLSEVVDYVIVMTYDQHWATSPISGSVAQYSWVENNIVSLMKEVPKEKLIMGIPFYTRQWKEAANSSPVSSSIAMANAKNIIRQYGAKVVWDDESGQDYAEFYIDKTKYRIWLEDARSIDLKSSLVLKYDLAGVAAWRRGYETHDIWDILNNNTKVFKTYKEWQDNKK